MHFDRTRRRSSLLGFFYVALLYLHPIAASYLESGISVLKGAAGIASTLYSIKTTADRAISEVSSRLEQERGSGNILASGLSAAAGHGVRVAPKLVYSSASLGIGVGQAIASAANLVTMRQVSYQPTLSSMDPSYEMGLRAALFGSWLNSGSFQLSVADELLGFETTTIDSHQMTIRHATSEILYPYANRAVVSGEDSINIAQHPKIGVRKSSKYEVLYDFVNHLPGSMAISELYPVGLNWSSNLQINTSNNARYITVHVGFGKLTADEPSSVVKWSGPIAVYLPTSFNSTPSQMEISIDLPIGGGSFQKINETVLTAGQVSFTENPNIDPLKPAEAAQSAAIAGDVSIFEKIWTNIDQNRFLIGGIAISIAAVAGLYYSGVLRRAWNWIRGVSPSKYLALKQACKQRALLNEHDPLVRAVLLRETNKIKELVKSSELIDFSIAKSIRAATIFADADNVNQKDQDTGHEIVEILLENLTAKISQDIDLILYVCRVLVNPFLSPSVLAQFLIDCGKLGDSAIIRIIYGRMVRVLGSRQLLEYFDQFSFQKEEIHSFIADLDKQGKVKERNIMILFGSIYFRDILEFFKSSEKILLDDYDLECVNVILETSNAVKLSKKDPEIRESLLFLISSKGPLHGLYKRAQDQGFNALVLLYSV